MPTMKPRTIAVDDPLWEAAREAARQEGEALSVVIRRYLRDYVAKMRAAA